VPVSPKVIALVPAYNEAQTIRATVAALYAQWAPRVDKVIVVPNNCTDNTAWQAAEAGAVVWDMGGNDHKKAGALNWALNQLLPTLADHDLVLITDADSVLHEDFTQHAVRALRRPAIRSHRVKPRHRKPVGAACASFRTDGGPTLLARLQRNEYERFARQVRRRQDQALVLSGVATMFTVASLRHIHAARGSELPGHPGEIYHRDTATEDIELTFAYRALGYRPAAPAQALAMTDSMPTWTALKDQRVRWQRGMLDSLRLYGVTRHTIGDLARQAFIYGASILGPAYLAFLAVYFTATGHVPFSAAWLPLTVVFLAERVWTARRGDVVLAAALIPEWCYEQWRSAVYWLAAWKTLRGARRDWINA
jgi:biofilm PGA synthesis N-glycosyltransferase PgaC